MSLTLVLESTTEQGIINFCEEVRGIFNPLFGEGTLKQVRDDGTTRTISCTVADGNPEFQTGSRGRNYGRYRYPITLDVNPGIYWQLVKIRFVASDPFWYGSGPNISYFTGSSYATFPWYIPWILGSGSTRKTITNDGSFDTPVRIVIYGDIINPYLQRVATVGGVSVTETITIVGQIGAGERFKIETDDKQRSAVYYHSGGTSENGIPYLNYSSKFWKLAPGSNLITFGKTTLVAGAYASIEWQDRYV